MSDRFSAWVSTADAVRATTKKLEKMALLGAYLGRLEDADLVIAARLFAGAPFSRKDERVLSVGWSALADVLLERSGKSDADMSASYQRHADLGDVAFELVGDSPPDGEPLGLVDVETSFTEMAAVRGTSAKRDVLRSVMRRATAGEARYITKVIAGETRIGLREGLLEDAIARAFARDRAAVARANMLTGDIGDAALRAKHGSLEEPTLTHFAPIGMMLATPVLDLAEVARRFPPPYVVDDKYDGVRAQVHKAGDRVELYSRTLDRVTKRYPELHDALLAIPGSYVLDAEILAFESDRAVPFTRFQTRLGRKDVSGELRTRLPASLVVFDILEREGRSLLDVPLAERLGILRTLPIAPPLRLALQRELNDRDEPLVAALEREFVAARDRGNEGLMVKDPRSPYRPGRRGMEWLKVKRALRTLDAVVTAVEWGHGKRKGVLSDYTFAVRDGDRLRNVGKAYSGLTDKEIAEMTEHFLATTIKDLGRLRIVRPDTVIEVAFDQMQESARHDSGYAMRFPRIVRLRPDKPVSEIDTLDTVREIARTVAGEHAKDQGAPSGEGEDVP
ncbi:MAG: ATP-dependent DNA ligase [Chloroflexi bacterium]|nr:MAG: ATP-dependent DNA ligase [Chloroflexota bacterium]TMB77520.1 MAG: ATP-dependent DNA ligase [Chloroflexota bacterium]TMB96494.1 MAG: ATP-dependent DNA ligase [Chloroflexota bacterium]TMC27894.1 MAG: ATP-dependent DNA ligase [Chloroflexota bacterium]TMC58369.1 MAG: ATP-dependent DNA ligase [Chloroflexota bacterium]